MLQILYFIIYGGKICYIFVVGSRFSTLGTTLGNSGLLSREVNFQAQAFDKSTVIYIGIYLFSYEEQEVFRKGYLILSKGVAKIYIGVFGFKGISVSVAEASKIQAKNEDIIDTINSVGAYKSISSFPNSKIGLGIGNLIDFGRVIVVVSIYFLQESPLLRVQLILFPFILIDIREFLEQARRRD